MPRHLQICLCLAAKMDIGHKIIDTLQKLAFKPNWKITFFDHCQSGILKLLTYPHNILTHILSYHEAMCDVVYYL